MLISSKTAPPPAGAIPSPTQGVAPVASDSLPCEQFGNLTPMQAYTAVQWREFVTFGTQVASRR